jgi:hypothetical protein
MTSLTEPRRTREELLLGGGMLLALGLIVFSVLLSPGRSHTTPAPHLAPGGVRVPADKAAQTPASKTTFTATTHNPKVNTPWTATVTAPAGRVQLDVMFAGRVVSKVASGTIRHGRWTHVVRWPDASMGYPLVLRATVTGGRRSEQLLFPIRVQR